MKTCAICEQPIFSEEHPTIQLENGEEAHLLCWGKSQDTAGAKPPDAAKQLAWQQLCEENGWRCRICGAVPELGQQFENNICEDCKISLRNYDPTIP